MDSGNHANLKLNEYPVSPRRESRRYKRNYILAQTDICTHSNFLDAVVQNDGAFCPHYPGNYKYGFHLKDWEWDERARAITAAITGDGNF